MQRVDAKQGLLVSCGVFTKDALLEGRNLFFSIRLWDQRALLDEITKHYENFDYELKADLLMLGFKDSSYNKSTKEIRCIMYILIRVVLEMH